MFLLLFCFVLYMQIACQTLKKGPQESTYYIAYSTTFSMETMLLMYVSSFLSERVPSFFT